MRGLKTISTNLESILEAMRTPPPDGFFVWDGKDEDERPLTQEEMRSGVAQYRQANGKSAKSEKKRLSA
jgi:hypothetical protein